MSLQSVPFYAGLLGLPLANGSTTTAGHVLVFGSIDTHDQGQLGCVASNATIAKEVGLSAGRVANIISELAGAGWIEVHLDEKSHRTGITSLATVHVGDNPPSRTRDETLHADVNIDTEKRNTKKQAGADAAVIAMGYQELGDLAGETYRVYVMERSRRRKPVSEEAARRQIKKLKQWYPVHPDAWVKVIDRSIENGWLGLFELPANGGNTGKTVSL